MSTQVNVEDLDTDDAYVHFYRNAPFSGEAVETTPEGRIVSTTAYVGGVENGPQRIWYPSGALKYDCTLRDGDAVGSATSWYESGAREEERQFDSQGKLLSIRRWNEAGQLTDEARWPEGF